MPIATDELIHEIFRLTNDQGLPPPLVTRVVKILYLADLEWRRQHAGDPLTTLTWRFLHFGPYADELIEALGGPDVEAIEFKDGRVGRTLRYSREHLASSRVPFEVSRLLDGLVSRWAGVDLKILLDHVYFDTEPMHDAQRGAPLDFTKISLSQAPPIGRLDPKKLKEVRSKLKVHAARLDLPRTGLTVSGSDLANESLWDEGEPPPPLAPGTEIRFR